MIAPQTVESLGCQSEAFANHSHNVVDFARRQRSVKALKATLEQAGHQVHVGAHGDFICSRWGMTRFCPDLAALRRFALVLGVMRS